MPITVEVWIEVTRPEVEARITDVVLPPGLIDDPRFELLRWVDPYGDTVFNSAQCLALDAELRIAAEEYESESLARVRPLAEQAANNVHRYLVFIGD